MLEEAADKCVEGSDMLPSLTSQNGESFMLRRILGSGGNSANASLGRRLSWRRRKMHLAQRIVKAEQAAIDAILEPDTEMPDVFKIPKEPRRSVRFANLQKLRSELSQQSTPHDLYKTNTIISVKEMKRDKQHEVASGTLARGEDDRPLKSLHWKALGRRHHCDVNSLKCEKCKRLLEVRKATERFEAKRAAKQLLQESNCRQEVEDYVCELGGGIQKIKREESFCRNFSLSNAQMKVQRSKTVPLAHEDANGFSIGGDSKWAQPVLSEMPKEVQKNFLTECSPRVSTPRPVDEEFKMERDTRKSLRRVSRLKLIREYMDDEPDFESEEITSRDLAPRSQTDVVFTLPGVCQQTFAEPSPLKPRILLLDMSPCESDGATNQFDNPDIVPEREFNQNRISARITEVMDIENTKWDNLHVSDEKGGETHSESDSQEELSD